MYRKLKKSNMKKINKKWINILVILLVIGIAMANLAQDLNRLNLNDDTKNFLRNREINTLDFNEKVITSNGGNCDDRSCYYSFKGGEDNHLNFDNKYKIDKVISVPRYYRVCTPEYLEPNGEFIRDCNEVEYSEIEKRRMAYREIKKLLKNIVETHVSRENRINQETKIEEINLDTEVKR